MTAHDESSGIRTAVLLAAGIGVALAILTSWPLPARMMSSMTESGPREELGDPYLVAWQIAWEGHALRTAPTELFDANYFYPAENTLSFLDPVHGFAPAGIIGSGGAAATLRYNVLFLFAKALAFLGAFLLARELRLGFFPSILAGAAFAYAPWRLDQLGHLLVISSGGIPLALFLLLRGYRRSRAGLVAAGWLTATWQLSIGYTLGLQLAYLLGLVGLLWLIKGAIRGWPDITNAVAAATVAGILFFLGWGVVQALPLIRVAKAHPEAVRQEWEVGYYSPPPRALKAASPNNVIWGERTTPIRATLGFPVEQTLFPGIVAVVLAVWGLGSSVTRPAVRVGLLLGALVFGYLALGLAGPDHGFAYRWLFDHVPGWRAIRTPGRLMTTATLFLALLAAHGLHQIDDAVRTRLSGAARRLIPAVIAISLTALIMLEGWGRTRLLPVAEVPESQSRAEEPVAHIPIDDGSDRVYMYWSTQNFARMVNGVAGFTPQQHATTTAMLNAFPDTGSVDWLRSIGVRSVVVHLARLPNAAEWEAAAAPRADELGLEVERIGGDLVYSLDP